MTGMPRRAVAAAALLAACALAVPVAGCTIPSDRSAVARPHHSPSAGTGPADGALFEPSDADFDAVSRLLAARAEAARRGDVRAFLATVDPRQPKLVAQQRVLAGNLARLEVERMSYVVDRDTLVPAAPVPGKAPRFRPLVTEYVQLPATLSGAVVNPVRMTFVRRDGEWLLGAENDRGTGDRLDAPQERPWFGGPIEVARSGPMTVLVDRGQAGTLAALTSSVAADLDYAADVLGLEPERQLLVDATSNGHSVNFSALVKEEAGAVSFELAGVGTDGRPGRVGSAIKLNPEIVGQALEQDGLMRHELTHFLLRGLNPSAPIWLSEGIAGYVQFYPSDFTRLVVDDKLYQRLMAADRRLPVVGLFATDPVVHYPVSQAAVAWLAQRGGVARLRELMRAYRKAYEGVNVDAPTPRLLRRVYGVREREVVAGAFALLAQLNH